MHESVMTQWSILYEHHHRSTPPGLDLGHIHANGTYLFVFLSSFDFFSKLHYKHLHFLRTIISVGNKTTINKNDTSEMYSNNEMGRAHDNKMELITLEVYNVQVITKIKQNLWRSIKIEDIQTNIDHQAVMFW